MTYNVFGETLNRVSHKNTTFEMPGSHPLKSFLLDIYYAMHNFSLIGNDLGVPHRPDKLLHNMKNSRKLSDVDFVDIDNSHLRYWWISGIIQD